MEENTGRDVNGRFVKGRIESQEEIRKRTESIKRHYEELVPGYRLRRDNPYIFNSWRAMWYTEKGKKAGCTEESWKSFESFFADVSPTYKKGYKFHRIDCTKPFSKENYIWMTPEQACLIGRAKKLIYIEYKGEKLSIKEWACKYNLSVRGITSRYYSKNKLTTEEILFGKKAIKRGSKTPKDAISNTQQERNKASKMISAYKIIDRDRNFKVCDIDIDWMIKNIMHKPCVYCGDTHKIGCDRVDNNKGHTKDNVVPCCYECNTVRNNNFTYEEMKILGKTIKEIKNNRIKKNEKIEITIQ